LKEKKDFGKKPVRRSRSEKSEEPARVYRPRTIKLSGWEPGSRREEQPFSEEKPRERPSARMSKRADSDSSASKPRFKKETGFGKSGMKRSAGESEGFRKGKRLGDKKFDDDRSPSRSRAGHKENYQTPYGEKRGRKTAYADSDERFGRSRESYDKPYGRGTARPGSKSDDRKGFGRREKYGDDFSTPRYEKGPRQYKQSGRSAEKPPRIEADLQTDKDGLIRLNKYIANSGLCSRREADEYIEKGYITVNNVTFTELGTKVRLTDEVRFKGKELDPEGKVYILLNKPKDYITTVDDPNAKRTVMELIEGACPQRVYPVGRLDRNSTGLLLLTNDGELTKRLTHPSFMKKKVYEVGLDKPLKPEDMKLIADGVEIDGDMIKPDAIEYIDPRDASLIGIEIHSGQNRIVRRIFEKIDYKVQKLDRVYYAGLTKKNLPRGKWRFLNQKEVNMLKMNRFD